MHVHRQVTYLAVADRPIEIRQYQQVALPRYAEKRWRGRKLAMQEVQSSRPRGNGGQLRPRKARARRTQLQHRIRSGAAIASTAKEAAAALKGSANIRICRRCRVAVSRAIAIET